MCTKYWLDVYHGHKTTTQQQQQFTLDCCDGFTKIYFTDMETIIGGTKWPHVFIIFLVASVGWISLVKWLSQMAVWSVNWRFRRPVIFIRLTNGMKCTVVYWTQRARLYIICLVCGTKHCIVDSQRQQGVYGDLVGVIKNKYSSFLGVIILACNNPVTLLIRAPDKRGYWG